MAEEDVETIGDVLSRTGALNKDDMIAEVESYGLEVKADWTKAEIMDHFEEFLTTDGGDAVPEEQPVEPAPQPEPKPEPKVGAVPQMPDNAPPEPPNVRIIGSQGWGNGPGPSYAP